MSSKKSKSAPTDDELNELLEGINEVKIPPSKGLSKSHKRKQPSQSEQDLLAELENLGAQQPSRPHTPRVQQVKRSNTATPPPASHRSEDGSSEEKSTLPRKSIDSTRSFHTSFTPSATSSDLQEAPIAQPATETPSAGGGWSWGSVFATATATASAAVNQAQAAVKEIQQNEEAKRWAEQVKGNVGVLRGFGGELRSRALPTFTNILHTLAPPISRHERLRIHITHRFFGYPPLDPLIYSTFSRAMAQVEGGDLLVIQRDQEFPAPRAEPDDSSAEWHDGLWWRVGIDNRGSRALKGLVEGTQVVRASAEAYSKEYFDAHGGIELAARRATEDLSESNPVRSSDIFVAVRAISHEAQEELFQGGPVTEKEGSVVDEKPELDELVSFAIYLYDPVHAITLHTLTQAIPAHWIHWLDTPASIPTVYALSASKQEASFFGSEPEDVPIVLPEEIKQIVDRGGVDPREWISEWVEETLSLGLGVIAQRYVARRMGLKERRFGKGKAKMEEVLGDGGGEAARAGLI